MIAILVAEFADEWYPTPIAERLGVLDQLRRDGVITDDEHARRRTSILDSV